MNPLQTLLSDHKRGAAVGIPSICSAHPAVLAASARLACQNNTPLLVEATSNQVNQFGGYTGMTPADFAAFVGKRAAAAGLPREQIILGGDHLGPHPWKDRASAEAMRLACDLARACAVAGFSKIHLDTSMNCADDPPGALHKAVAAGRAADMAAACEAVGSPVWYVIGTEVPPPGGVQEETGLRITSPQDAYETCEAFREAFYARGLDSAWERVIALVVQPGVEFGDASIHAYRRSEAAALSQMMQNLPGMVFEAHSTDYQTPAALRQLVEDHFAILKVGPALTFAYREAVFALEAIERELLRAPTMEWSCLQETLEAEMLAHPQHWIAYYHGNAETQRLSRRFSLSDRIRYYWGRPAVQAALERLFANLSGAPIPLALISQFLPGQRLRVQTGELRADARLLAEENILDVLRDYHAACTNDSPHAA